MSYITAIAENAVLGQDCELSVATASYSGTLAQFEEFSVTHAYRQAAFKPAASAIARVILECEEIVQIKINVTAGLNFVWGTAYEHLFGQEITDLSMTDYLSYAQLAARYGKIYCVEVGRTQGSSQQMVPITLIAGVATHGYNAP